MNTEEARALKDTFNLAEKTSIQAHALEIFCGYLLAQSATNKPNPKKYISDISAEFLGFIDPMSEVGGPHLTECVERVLRYSEKMIAGPLSGPRQAV